MFPIALQLNTVWSTRIRRIALLWFALVFAFSNFIVAIQPANATIAKYINFQGKITQVSNGTNVANGSYTVEFKIYDALSAGSLLWTESWDGAPAECPQLTVTNGVFNAKLGSCNSLSGVDFTTGSLYISVNFNADGEMSPRKQLVASPFAFVANSVNGDGTISILNTGATQATIGYDSSNKYTTAVSNAGAVTFDASGSSAGFTFSDSVTSSGLLTGSLGATISGAVVNLNASSNFGVNIATGTSTGTVTIGSTTTTQALLLQSGTGDVTITSTDDFSFTATDDITLNGGSAGSIIAIGTNTHGNVLNIGTDNTTSDTISIGSVLDNVAITGDQWSITDAGALTVQSCSGCGGGGGALDTLTASTTDDTALLNADNTIAWHWALTSATSKGITLGESAASTGGSGDQHILKLLTASTSTAGPLEVLSNSADGGDVEINLNSAGDFEIQDAGTAFVTFTDGGLVQIASTNATGTTTSAGLSLSGNSLTTGTGLYSASSSLTSGKLVDLQVSGTSAAASQTALNILTTGTNGTAGITTYGAQIANSHDGSTSTNIGLLLSASGGTTANYALITNGGNVGIGSASPQALLEVAGADTVDGIITLSADRSDDSGDSWFLKSLASGNAFTISNEASEVFNLSTAGALTLTGALAVNGDSLTADGATLTINAGGAVDIQDNVTVDSLIADTGNIAITSGLLSLGGTTRISNAGVGTFITGTAIGSQTFTTNNISDSGALTISSSGAGNDIILSSADTVNIQPAGFIINIGGGTTETATRFLEDSDNGTDYAGIKAPASVTTSYTWTLPAADASGCIQSNGSGTLSISACGGGSQTPWTSAIDADGFSLQDALNIEFRTAVGSAPAGTVISLYADNSGDLTANVLTGKTLNVAVNGTDEYTFSSTALNLDTNTLQGSTAVIDFTDFDVDSDGKVIIAPDSAGDAVTLTGFAGDFQGLVIDATATSTNASGIIDINFDTATANASAIDIALTTSGTTSSLTDYGMKIGFDPGHATNSRTIKLLDLDISGDSGSLADTIYGINIDTTTATNTADLTTAVNLVSNVNQSGATAVAGILGTYTMTNSTASGFQFGNRFLNTISSTTAGTHVGQFLRMTDDTSLSTGQVVRGMEVQAWSGTNNNGTNTGIASFGKTFGVHAATSSQAGAVSQPAAIFADLDNGTDATTKTLGNAIRAYTDNATSANMISVYQESSAYTGTGLVMNFANNSGTFNSGNFVDFQKAGTTYFKVASTGVTSVNLNAAATTNGVCHSGANVDAQTDTVRDLVACSGAPADLAEWYETEVGVEAGDLVAIGDREIGYEDEIIDPVTGLPTGVKALHNFSVLKKTSKAYDNKLMGVVSTSPFQSMGRKLLEANPVNPKSVALVGRVPLKVNLENGDILPGDFLTASSVAGVAMKATSPGLVIGQALQKYDSTSLKQTITAFVNPIYFDPGLVIAEDGHVLMQRGAVSTELVSETSDTGSLIIKQNGSGDILQLQDKDTNRLLIASTGATSINANLASGLVLEVKNNGNNLLTIDHVGNVVASGKLILEKDLVVLGRILGSTSVMARNASSLTLRQGDLVAIVGASDEEWGDNPIVEIVPADNQEHTAVIGVVDRNLTEFGFSGDTLREENSNILPGQYLNVVTNGSFKMINLKSGEKVQVGEKLGASDEPGLAKRVSANSSSSLGISLDASNGSKASVRVFLFGGSTAVLDFQESVSSAQSGSSSDSSTGSSSDADEPAVEPSERASESEPVAESTDPELPTTKEENLPISAPESSTVEGPAPSQQAPVLPSSETSNSALTDG